MPQLAVFLMTLAAAHALTNRVSVMTAAYDHQSCGSAPGLLSRTAAKQAETLQQRRLVAELAALAAASSAED